MGIRIRHTILNDLKNVDSDTEVADEPQKIVYNALVGSLIAFLTAFGIITHNKNKMLSEELLEAQNNIEAYQGMLSNSQQANNVLTLDMKKLGQSKDSLLVEMDRIAKENNIKSKIS